MLPVVVVQRRLCALNAARGAVHRRLHVVPRVVEGQVLGELLLAREVTQADGAALVALVVGVAGVLGLLGHPEIQNVCDVLAYFPGGLKDEFLGHPRVKI